MEQPKLVVTVALFTVLEDINRDEVSVKNLHPQDLSYERFGMGLFVVTRRTNSGLSSSDRSDSSLPPFDRDTSLTSSASDRSSVLPRVLPERAVGQFESMEEAARLLVSDELGIEAPVRLRQTRIFDNPKRDLRERTISITYWAFANLEDVAPVLGGRDQVGLELVNSSEFLDSWKKQNGLEDYDGVCRFGYRQAPVGGRPHAKVLPEQMGTGPILDQDHDDMVFLSWRRLRHAFSAKMDPFRVLGAKALPDAFRLSDLRELHDVSRGERSQSDQFRRAMLSEGSFLEQSRTSESGTRRPGKPATLYTLKKWADPDNSDSSGISDED